MKTYRSTFNSYFIYCSLVIAATLTSMMLSSLAPYRAALSTTLGLAENQLWILVAPLAISTLLALSIRLRAKLSEPLETFSEQCSLGSVAIESNQTQSRELRIIRSFMRLCQDRAQERAQQVSKMEEELFATRKTNERKLRKIEELEDLIASYGRIRKELNYDISLLRQENRDQDLKIRSLQDELSDLRARHKDQSIYLGSH